MTAAAAIVAIVVYLAVAVLAFRWAIRRTLREWPLLPLSVGFCVYIAVTWPVAVPTMALLTYQAKPREWSRLRRWADR